MKRHYVTLGATTTASGKVTTASSFMSINGVTAALDHDKVWCPQCKTEGYIALDGPRLSSTYNGKQYALHDDLCICKCSPPPRLVAVQDHSSQTIDADWHAAQADATSATAEKLNAAGSSQTDPYCIPILLLDPATDEPFKNRPYRLELANKVIEGTTDQYGATRPLTDAERASVVTWHVDGEMAST